MEIWLHKKQILLIQNIFHQLNHVLNKQSNLNYNSFKLKGDIAKQGILLALHWKSQDFNKLVCTLKESAESVIF